LNVVFSWIRSAVNMRFNRRYEMDIQNLNESSMENAVLGIISNMEWEIRNIEDNTKRIQVFRILVRLACSSSGKGVEVKNAAALAVSNCLSDIVNLIQSSEKQRDKINAFSSLVRLRRLSTDMPDVIREAVSRALQETRTEIEEIISDSERDSDRIAAYRVLMDAYESLS